MGVASVPAAMVAEELGSGELARINYDWAPEDLHFYARYDAERSPEYVVKSAELARSVAESFLAG